MSLKIIRYPGPYLFQDRREPVIPSQYNQEYYQYGTAVPY